MIVTAISNVHTCYMERRSVRQDSPYLRFGSVTKRPEEVPTAVIPSLRNFYRTRSPRTAPSSYGKDQPD